MISEKLVRVTLWISVPFNLVAAYGLAYPGSLLGILIGLPSNVPPLYSALLAFLIAGFGLAYGWAARQQPVDKTVVGLGTIGKYGVFIIAGLLMMQGSGPTGAFVVAIGDAIFATIWLLWLLGERKA